LIHLFEISVIPQGLSPSTQYRVTVRAKQLRAPGQQQQPPPITGAAPHELEAPGAYTDFRTLAKGLPDPPQVNYLLIYCTFKLQNLKKFLLQSKFFSIL
jgi:hypothetical protein